MGGVGSHEVGRLAMEESAQMAEKSYSHGLVLQALTEACVSTHWRYLVLLYLQTLFKLHLCSLVTTLLCIANHRVW